jgi:subtilisin family serine protease
MRWARFVALGAAGIAGVVIAGSAATRGGAAPGVSSRAEAASGAGYSIAVRARSESDVDAVAAYAASLGYTVSGRVTGLPALRVTPPAGVSLSQAITAFRSKPGVLYAEPSYRLQTADVPADPLYSREAPYLQAVHAPDAWNIEQGKPSVIVAVLDTGIDLNHPDLQGRLWSNAGETPNNGIDDDGNGCIDDVNGCAFIGNPSPGCSGSVNGNVNDELGHGTFVSGIIAANGNSVGMVGIARNVTIMPVKVLDCNGEGDSLALTQGILYAARAGARVENISLGGPIGSAITQEAIRVAHDQYGVVIVAATGNTGKSGVAYPAAYPQVIAVGAASSADPTKRAVFSSSGPEVDVVTVGQGIVGTVPKSSCLRFLPCISGGPYAVGDGTSFSAPQVAGLVALMLSHYSSMKPDQVLGILKATADPLPAGDRPNWAGSGRVNMLQALKPAYRLGAPGVTKS